MSKVLVFVALVALVFLIFKKRRARDHEQDRSDRRAPAQGESMVSCAYCKLHIPMTESLRHGSRHYCSEEHRRLHGGHGGI